MNKNPLRKQLRKIRNCAKLWRIRRRVEYFNNKKPYARGGVIKQYYPPDHLRGKIYKGTKTMPIINHDRVRFKVPGRRLFSYNVTDHTKDKYLQLLKECFQIENHELHGYSYNDEIIIVCRPSQFGRFIVKRNQMGLQNCVRELDAEIIPRAIKPREISVYDRKWRLTEPED